MLVTKMNGDLEPADMSKINRQVQFACAGLNASPSQIVANAQIKIVDGMKTSRIQDILIETSKHLITEKTPDYSIVTSRLINHKIHKIAYGKFTPPKLIDHVKNCVKLKKYDPEILDKWSGEDFEIFDNAIKHSRDEDFHLAGMNQFTGKYMMRMKKNDLNTIIETPQMIYMMISCTLHHSIPDVLEAYEEFSTHKVSLPTPIMAGVRSPERQFSSCVLIDTGDSLNSINSSVSTIVNYVSSRAGIGMNLGRIRGIGAQIGYGEKEHTGVLPFLKHHVSALKSCSQGGVRGGSGTAYFPLWHWEIESILTWKNNRGTEESRERRCDYGITINDSMIERYLTKQPIYIFDPKTELYEAYHETKEVFDEVYERHIKMYEAGLIRGKIIDSNALFMSLMDNRSEVGRIYPVFINTMNDMSPFEAHKIYMSNLCLEIALPTKPAESLDDPEGIVSLCTLMSVNAGKFTTIEAMRDELPRTMRVAVRTLDNLLSYQDYCSKLAYRSTELFRSLGIGIVNAANFLAKNKCSYGSEKGLNLMNELWAAMYYHGKRESIILAKERGACEASKLGQIDPFVHFKHDAKFNLPKKLGLSETIIKYDFEALKVLHDEFGIRNATIFALAPTETSSQLLNATNGIEMPRSIVSVKGSKDSLSYQVIPNPELAEYYDFLWDQKTPESYLKTVAVISRWCDQSISANTFYNPAHFEGGVIPRHRLMYDLLLAWSLGIKTLYYQVIHDNSTDKREIIEFDVAKTLRDFPIAALVEMSEDDDPCGGACII